MSGKRGLLFGFFVLALPALGVDAEEERRPPGEGVLCAYDIYHNTQYVVKACGWDRLIVDDTIDDAVARIEQYIVANSSSPAKRDEASGGRLRELDADWVALTETERQKFCNGTSDGAELPRVTRTIPPAEIDRIITELTSAPGEPTYGTCF
jgi:hypothetical protein